MEPRMPALTRVEESISKWVASKPVTFEEFTVCFRSEAHTELVNGTVVERSMVQLDHELLQNWLSTLLSLYVQETDAGVVLGSRSAVRINNLSARLPDLLFVRQERRNILQQNAIVGPPDLIVEIVSPSDYISHLNDLEADYCSIGVPEIVFIDIQRRRVWRVRRQGDTFDTEHVTGNTFAFDAFPALILQREWLFDTPRPKASAVLAGIG